MEGKRLLETGSSKDEVPTIWTTSPTRYRHHKKFKISTITCETEDCQNKWLQHVRKETEYQRKYRIKNHWDEDSLYTRITVGVATYNWQF
jgi:hypothetical protein